MLEVYDKELVDQLFPYKKEDFQAWQHAHMESITEAELERVNML